MRTKEFAVCFDIGGTLTINTFGLNWTEHYHIALARAFTRVGITDSLEDYIATGKKVLTKYNTRVNPRLHEVSAIEIFDDILKQCSLPTSYSESICQQFFDYFYMESHFHEDVLVCLDYLKNDGYKIAYLSDVAYGQNYNERYYGQVVTKLKSYSDILLTSVDVGFRKPSQAGYLKVAELLSLDISKIVYVGDEEKDMVGANNCGMISVYIDRKKSANNFNQHFTINSLNELPYILETLNS